MRCHLPLCRSCRWTHAGTASAPSDHVPVTVTLSPACNKAGRSAASGANAHDRGHAHRRRQQIGVIERNGRFIIAESDDITTVQRYATTAAGQFIRTIDEDTVASGIDGRELAVLECGSGMARRQKVLQIGQHPGTRGAAADGATALTEQLAIAVADGLTAVTGDS